MVHLHESNQIEEVTFFQKGVVFPQYANDINRLPKSKKSVFVGETEKLNEKVQKSIAISWSLRGYNEVVSKDKELTTSLNNKINVLTGKTEKLQITKEWKKDVAGTINYYWLNSAENTYSVSILLPL